MKRIATVIFLLIITACTYSNRNITQSTPVVTRSGATIVPASPSHITPTGTRIPSTSTAIPSPTQTKVNGNFPWWNDAVFYELSVPSFYDSNHDGIGDFNGLIDKLDYLNDGDPNTTTDLGITGIWLLPIHPSPSFHGYDVTDYYAVNPDYGTMDDFRRLVDEAHHRGIRIIIDLVINHTSSQHPWFIQSQDPKSTYRNWYVWADAYPGWKGPWNQQVWYPLNNAYYYAFFWEGMPDLNYSNPDVTAEMENITRFWLDDVGIDGFRLDAIGSLIEEGPVTIETKSSHDWFANYYKYYKGLAPDAMTIGEIWREDAVVVPWVANSEVDLAFDFDLSAAMLASIKDGNSSRVLETLKSGTSQFPEGQYGTFLTNHDMMRVVYQLSGNTAKAKVAASLYLLLPGVPFVYYGEEIGMTSEKIDRLPMQWSASQYAGFSDVLPIMMPDNQYATVNVSSQASDPDSILSHYRTLISLRNSHPALRIGELYLLSTLDQGLFACLRTTSDEHILVLLNLTNSPIQNYQLSLDASTLPQGEFTATSLMGVTNLALLRVFDNGTIRDYVPLPEIPSYATIIFLLQSE
jgi:alpha-amylase